MNSGSLTISWDSKSPALINADRATLWIREGNIKHTVELTRIDLDYGKLAYAPSGALVALRMEVANEHASDELLVLNNSVSSGVTNPSFEAPLLPNIWQRNLSAGLTLTGPIWLRSHQP
jgi:hypothetical protein